MTPPVPATFGGEPAGPLSPSLNRQDAMAWPLVQNPAPASRFHGSMRRTRYLAAGANMGLMGAPESLPVPAGAAPPPEGLALGRLLALLGDGVSAEGLETQLAAMQAKNLIDPVTAAAARSLNARLREASRREGLLRVLYDTATDLTGIRDVEAVLKAIAGGASADILN